MSDSENTKTVGIHPANSKLNINITIFICTIFTGYILKNIYEYFIYFNKNRFSFFTHKNFNIREKSFNKFSNICSLVSLVAFFLLFVLTLLLFLYIIKDSYNLNNLNKNLITIGFPIILGLYFLNTILFTMNYSNIEKITNSNKKHKHVPFNNEDLKKIDKEVFKNKAVISRKLYQLTPREFQKKGIKTKLLFNPKPNPLYILNPFNLTLLISMIYMIYWDNWDSPSWEKWSIYISSVIVFNLLLGLIYFFQTRTKKDKIFTRKINVNSGTRNSNYEQNNNNYDLGVQNQNNQNNLQRTNTNGESFHIQKTTLN